MHRKRLLAVLVPSLALGAVTPEPVQPRHVEIDGRGTVMTKPRQRTAKGRKVFELEIELSAYLLAPEQPGDADKTTVVDMVNPVRVVHDIGCGGELSLSVTDKVEFRGEYVEVPDGPDVVRFTHASSAKGCGEKAHPAGFLRKAAPATPTPAAVTPPRPVGVVPDQPWRGTPVPSAKAYLEILRLKQAGASDEKLLEKIRSEKKSYPMALGEMQELKDAGVSQAVIEAMLQSGRRVLTPGGKPAPTATPGS